jgi:uncharacterized protein YcfJ
MKSVVTITALVASASYIPAALAGHTYTDYARVLQVTPQYEEVRTPHKQCTSEYVDEPVRRSDSMAGPLIGGIAGGILGAQVGKGNGRVASSAAGAAIGAIVGERLSRRDAVEYREREVRRCEFVDHWETHLTGYRVVYRYRGREHSTMLPYDPGRRLRVRVAVEPLDDSRGRDHWDQ